MSLDHNIRKYRVIPSDGIDPPIGTEPLALFNKDGTPYEPSGSLVQSFEINDLVIPVGTNWWNELHEIGQFSVDCTKGIFFQLLAEFDSPSADGMRFGFTDGVNAATANIEEYVLPAAPSLWDQRAEGLFLSGGLNQEVSLPLDNLTIHVGLFGPNPITTEFSVVKARAAFMII